MLLIRLLQRLQLVVEAVVDPLVYLLLDVLLHRALHLQLRGCVVLVLHRGQLVRLRVPVVPRRPAALRVAAELRGRLHRAHLAWVYDAAAGHHALARRRGVRVLRGRRLHRGVPALRSLLMLVVTLLLLLLVSQQL